MATPRQTTPAPETYDPPKGPYLTVSFGWSTRTWNVTLTPASVAAMAVMMLVAAALHAYKPAPRELPMSSVAVHASDPAVSVAHGGSFMAPGQPPGQTGDVITPLNVRDAAALVMPPWGDDPPAAATAVEPPRAPDSTDALVGCPTPPQPAGMVPGVLVPR